MLPAALAERDAALAALVPGGGATSAADIERAFIDLASRRDGELSDADEAERRALLGKAIEIEGACLERIEAAAASGEVVPERDLAAALRDYFDRDGGGTVDNVRRLAGGFSKETAAFVLLNGHGARTPLVLRKEQAVRYRTTVDREYGILTALHAAGLPVPEPIRLEMGDNPLGEPFLTVRHVDGGVMGDVWGADSRPPRSLAEDLARLLARLHTLDVAPFDLPEDRGRSVVQRITAHVARSRDAWHAYKLREAPLLEALFAWLMANVPEKIDRPVLVHGDAGFHNIIARDGRIAALVDWETAHVGDPAEDLSYVRPYMEPILPWDEFLAIYRAAGGPAYQAENARYYEVWRGVWRATASIIRAGMFERHPDCSLNAALAAEVFTQRFLVSAARQAGFSGGDA